MLALESCGTDTPFYGIAVQESGEDLVTQLAFYNTFLLIITSPPALKFTKFLSQFGKILLPGYQQLLFIPRLETDKAALFTGNPS